jgi:hypothetical protein
VAQRFRELVNLLGHGIPPDVLDMLIIACAPRETLGAVKDGVTASPLHLSIRNDARSAPSSGILNATANPTSVFHCPDARFRRGNVTCDAS